MSTAELGIFITDGRTEFRPGETLSVSALWALPAAPGTLESYFHHTGFENAFLDLRAIPAGGEWLRAPLSATAPGQSSWAVAVPGSTAAVHCPGSVLAVMAAGAVRVGFCVSFPMTVTV